MVRYLGWLANTALFILCCSLVADTANAIIAALLSQTPSAAIESGPTASAQGRSWEERQRIVDRNLFHSSTITANTAAPGPANEALEETELPLKLWGTIASDDADLAWASIEEVGTQNTSAFRVGDQIQAATVVGIERRRVVLLENGNRRALTLDDDTESPAGPAPRAASSSARAGERPSRRTSSAAAARKSMRDRTRQLSEDHIEAEPQNEKAVANNPAALYSQARILPKVGEDGQVAGLEISAIQAGSVFERAGIQNGEVITEIDGVPISSIGKSAQIMSALTDQGGVNVTLESAGGAPRSLPFDAQ
jgi:general secretion pathway protein C